MDGALFILMFVCLALVAGWYVGNELKGGRGDWGWLAIRSAVRDAPAEAGARYRPKDRVKPSPADVIENAAADAPAASPSRYRDAAPRQRFQSKDDSAYRTRGPLPRLGDRPK